MLVLRQSLLFGPKAGFRASLAPLLTDTVAIGLALLLVQGLPKGFERPLEVLGGAFLIYWAVQGWRKPVNIRLDGTPIQDQSLRQAVLLNLVNPNMYGFWIGVGVPLLNRFGNDWGWFLLGFYPAIVGSKAALGWLIARFRHLPWMGALARNSNLVLLILGIYVLLDGLLQP